MKISKLTLLKRALHPPAAGPVAKGTLGDPQAFGCRAKAENTVLHRSLLEHHHFLEWLAQSFCLGKREPGMAAKWML